MTARLFPGMLGSLLLAFACGAAAQATGQEAPPADDAGVSPATQDMYRSALQSISDGRKDDAAQMLEQVILNEARHAGAWLDLALIRCALGQREEAERLFRHIEVNFDPPPGIVELIAESRAGGCREWRPLGQASASLGRGTAQNVNQGTKANGTDLGLPVDLPVADEFRPAHDQFNTLTVDLMRELSGNGTVGFAQFQGRRYDKLRDYDTASLFVGVETPWRWGDHVVRGSALLGAVTLGGKLYQEQAQAQLRSVLPWSLPYGTKLQVAGTVSHVRYLTLQNFDANSAELRAQLLYRSNSLYASAGGSYLYDKAEASRPGGDRDGWQFSALVRRQLPFRTIGELGFNRQTWRNREQYSPGLIDIVRRQGTNVWRGMLNYPVNANHSIVLEGRIIRNNENISLFQYNDRQLQVSWQWQSQ